ncbi:dehydrogenase [Pseudomonas cichorii]|uniref:PQQ-dependent sugar dehydrogenase n=1 Tax=Pseudomonas cichorii TaxID=36746 RepID=UPI0019102F90|nr:PQQ-dependent sugar dehydrogenase [Pseudomonas cichorii]GFM85497.1 dehydrogenase [Pseudomonas cichorii]
MRSFGSKRPRHHLILVSGFLALIAPPSFAKSAPNAGQQQPSISRPFSVTPVAAFREPWAIAFLPDSRLLVTEKAGRLFITTQDGVKKEVEGVPQVQYGGQNGLLDVAVSPTFDQDSSIYLSFVEPVTGGSGLALARGRLDETEQGAALKDLTVIWRQEPKAMGSQPGGVIAFSPDGQHLFLTSGDRRHPDSAQDLDSALGKVIRLDLDGTTPADNPMASRGGVRAQIWTSGHRNPYGLAFSTDGKLWQHEMGPQGGDELNLLQAGRNYGWPVVSNGDNYGGSPIPDHDQDRRPEFAGPALFWTPVISPAGMSFYSGPLFPEWNGSALIGSLSATGLIRVSIDPRGIARQEDRWNLGKRIRDVAVAPDGAVWLVEDGTGGMLVNLRPDHQ